MRFDFGVCYLYLSIVCAIQDSMVHGEKRIKNPWDLNIYLFFIFQLLIRLCAYVPAVEELARKDDLTLLFSAVTSPVPEHNLVTILIDNP